MDNQALLRTVEKWELHDVAFHHLRRRAIIHLTVPPPMDTHLPWDIIRRILVTHMALHQGRTVMRLRGCILLISARRLRTPEASRPRAQGESESKDQRPGQRRKMLYFSVLYKA